MPVTLEISDRELTVRLSGVSGALALRSKLTVPLVDIADARALDAAEARAEGSGFKVGAHIPGLLKAGSYGTGDSKQFWYVTNADRLLVVDLDHDRFQRLVLEVDDVDGDVERIRSARPAD
jgi:hypothetical protein